MSRTALQILLPAVAFIALAFYLDHRRPVAAQVENSSHSAAPVEVTKPQPVYDWVEVKRESSIISPTAAGLIWCESCDNDKKIRVVADAPLPFTLIATGVTQKEVQGDSDAVAHNVSARIGASTCRRENMLRADIQCEIKEPGKIAAALDDRNVPTAADAVIAGGLAAVGVKGPMQNMTTSNHVDMTMYAWRCVRNCAQ